MVNAIEDSAFANCTQIKEINIPDSVTSIGNAVSAYDIILTKNGTEVQPVGEITISIPFLFLAKQKIVELSRYKIMIQKQI